MLGYFTRLEYGHIVGVIDAYGAVHSEFTGDTIVFHADKFPKHHCQWRWCHSRSIWWVAIEQKPTEEQYDAIQRHLTKKYGIQWQKNGYHDIDHLQRMWAQEKESSS